MSASAELGHVDRAHRPGPEVVALQRAVGDAAAVASRDVRAAAAAVAPRAGQRRQRGDRRVGGGRAEVALRAHPEPQQRRPGGANSRPTRSMSAAGTPQIAEQLSTVWSGERRQQLVVALGVRAAPLLVLQPGIDDRAHHADRQRRVGAGQRAQVLVRHARRAAAERVHHDEPRACCARVEQLAPEVGRRRERVPAPHDHVARVRPLLGVDLGGDAVGRRGAGEPGRRADGALQRGGAERVDDAGAHDVALDQALGAHVPVGQDRLAAELVARRVRPRPRGRAPRPRSPARSSPRPSARRGRSGCRTRSSA